MFLTNFYSFKRLQAIFHTFPSYIPRPFSLACGGMPCCRPTNFRPKSLNRIRKLSVESLLRSEFFGRIFFVFFFGLAFLQCVCVKSQPFCLSFLQMFYQNALIFCLCSPTPSWNLLKTGFFSYLILPISFVFR